MMRVVEGNGRQRKGAAGLIERRRRKTSILEADEPESAHALSSIKNNPNNYLRLLIWCIFAAFFLLRVYMRWGAEGLEKRVEKYLQAAPKLRKGAPWRQGHGRSYGRTRENHKEKYFANSLQRILEVESRGRHAGSPDSNVTISQPTEAMHSFPASMCVSSDRNLTENALPGCQVSLCSEAAGSLDPAPGFEMGPHYGYGFVHRPVSLRNIVMKTSGQASSGSGCAISHKYQFIYIHVLKSGGMTLKTFLKQGLCQNSTTMPCQSGSEYLEIVTCSTAVIRYPNYFVWSFVRNPYGRMYSTYAMALGYTAQKGKPNLPPFTFDAFVHAKGEIGVKHNRARQKGSRRFMTYLNMVHCRPQHYFLFNRHDCPVFDFLGHLENFADDLKTVVDTIASPELAEHYKLWLEQASTKRATTNSSAVALHKDTSTAFGSKQKQKQHGGSLEFAYRSAAGLQEAVANEYAKDFALLGYDPAVVPP